MQRDTLSILIVTASLLAMALVGAAVVSPIGADDPASDADRTITVDASGGADTEPDRGVVNTAAVAEGDDPAAVRDELTERADALRTNLEAAGLTDDDYETTEYRIREPRRPPREEGTDEPDYRGVHSFEVNLDDPDRIGAVIDAAADADAEVGDIEFTLSETVRDELREDAIDNAMDDARVQADSIADNGALQVTGVAHVDATQRSFSTVSYEVAATPAPEDDAATDVDTGDVSVTYDVEVTYNATAN